MGKIVAWGESPLGTNRRLGQIVAFWNLGQIVAWDESPLGKNCRFLEFEINYRLGRIVAFWNLRKIVVAWDESPLGTRCRFLKFRKNCRLGRIAVLHPSVFRQNDVNFFLYACISSIFGCNANFE